LDIVLSQFGIHCATTKFVNYDTTTMDLQSTALGSATKLDLSTPKVAPASPPLSSPELLLRKEQEQIDLAVALSLQEQFNTAALVSTSQGRAWDFVHKVAANHRRLIQYDSNKPDWNGNNFKVVHTDDLVYTTKRLLDMQDAFRAAGKPVTVDIGFHYTDASNMHRIRTDGLLTKAEREASQIRAEFKGATFGDGVYLANNPYSYHKFCGGEQGLLVARLKGSVEQKDTVLGREGDSDEVCVLQQSAQCVALVQYHADVVSLNQDEAVGNQMVHEYHCSLQAVVDECFNDGQKTEVLPLKPSEVIKRVHASYVPPPLPTSYRNPNIANFISKDTYTAPKTLVREDHKQMLQAQLYDVACCTEQNCNICLESMFIIGGGCVAKLRSCSHIFPRTCIETSLEHSRKCPICRKAVGSAVSVGSMPSGTMKIEGCPYLDCSGNGKVGSLKITYDMDPGTQKAYHVNPGEEYDGTVRITFVPDTVDGRNLVKRLRYAFIHGLTFTIGTSLTTGQDNKIVWASIHHKTSTSAGPHGYPDPGYFINANEELDALHVPAAADI